MSKLSDLTVAELEEYADLNDIDISDAKSKQQKLFAIEKFEAENKPYDLNIMGVDISISANILDDLELLDWFDEVENGNVLKLPKALFRMFGADCERVLASLRNKKGVVPASKGAEFFKQIIEGVNAKNS